MNQPRQTAPGSTALDPQSQTFYVDQFGDRYLHVQQTPGVPSRDERRREKRGKRRGDGKPKE